MTITRSLVQHRHYLSISVYGSIAEDLVRQSLLALRDEASKSGQTRILIDASDMVAPENEFDRYLIGKAIAEILGDPYRVAILYPAHLINKFVEDTAVGRGATVLVSGDQDQALEWLIGDLQARGD